MRGTEINGRILYYVGIYNHKMLPDCDWDDLTSPPHDFNVATQLAKTINCALYAFINLTGKQIIALSVELNKMFGELIKKGLKPTLLFHFSGHGGVLLSKLYLKQVLVGTDGKTNGRKGVASFYKIMNRHWLKQSPGIYILDCCREYVECRVSEEKGVEDNKEPPSSGKLVIHTTGEGTQAKAKIDSASAFSLNLLKNMDLLKTDKLEYDLIKYFELCSQETHKSEKT
eukprot:UN30091